MRALLRSLVDKATVDDLTYLGCLYDKQKKYELAEEYYKRALAIDKNNVRVLNIIHLFAVDQASTVTTDQIKDYYQRVQQNSDVIKRYSDGYPNAWKLIQNKMKKILNNSKC